MKIPAKIHWWFYFFRLYDNGRLRSLGKAIRVAFGARVFINPPHKRNNQKVRSK
jgi:hypothetical protein